MRSKDCNFHRNQTFVGRIDHFLSIFGPQNLCHLIARLNKRSPNINLNAISGDYCVMKHAKNFHCY